MSATTETLTKVGSCALREIREMAAPNWTAAPIEIDMLFVFEALATIPDDASDQIAALVKRVELSGRYAEIIGRAVALDTLSAVAYVSSDRLDLEHLSTQAP